MKSRALCLFLAFTLSGCGALRGMVRNKAGDDLGCPTQNIHVEGIASYTYRAIGCGRWADYRCVSTANGQPYCHVRSEPARPPPTPEEWARAHALGARDD